MSGAAPTARQLLRMAGDLLSWGWRTGAWWLPALALALGLTAALAGSAQVVVPKVAYALF